ncbi:hypothetical protein COCSADRAFT_34945, partial [Bipolaris sorokiniana ND90Pr]
HQRARGHFPSHVCRGSCRHPPVAQYNFTIRKCGYCGKLCERLDIFEDHYIATGHCFCSECDLPFESQSAWKNHCEVELHASEYRCCNCDISFKDIHALNAHMARLRTFPSLQSFQQHCESIKHKPLSALSCPIGKGCKRKFSAPSALLHHLESGKCCSGMDRDDIYDIIQLYDKDHTIHTLPKLTPSSSTYLSAHGLSPDSGTPTASLDSSDGWLLVTPTHSQGSVEGSLVDWTPLEDSRLSLGSRHVIDGIKPELRCPLCPRKSKAFRTIQALQQHIVSPTHCDKAETKQGKAKQFTTLSGLAQHLESGPCHGGRQTFLRCIELGFSLQTYSNSEQLALNYINILDMFISVFLLQ